MRGRFILCVVAVPLPLADCAPRSPSLVTASPFAPTCASDVELWPGWRVVRGPGFTICLPSAWQPAGRSGLFGKTNRWAGSEGDIVWNSGPFGEYSNSQNDPGIGNATFGLDYGGPSFEREVIGGREAHVIGRQSSEGKHLFVEWRGLRLHVNAVQHEHVALIQRILHSVRFVESRTVSARPVLPNPRLLLTRP